jgi:hypothetical protein
MKFRLLGGDDQVGSYRLLNILGVLFWIPMLLSSPMFLATANLTPTGVLIFYTLFTFALVLALTCLFAERMYAKADENRALFILKIPVYYGIFFVILVHILTIF